MTKWATYSADLYDYMKLKDLTDNLHVSKSRQANKWNL